MQYLWALKVFEPRGRVSEVEAWYDGLKPAQRMRVRAERLEYLVQLPRHLWQMPAFEEFSTGPCKGLGNIRIKVERNHFRLLGFFGPDDRGFTVLSFHMKKTRTLPKNDCETAHARRIRVIEDTGLIHEWQF